MSLREDTEVLASLRSQNCNAHNAPTCTEPSVAPNTENTSFSTPPRFTSAKTNQSQAQLLAQGAAAACLRRGVKSRLVQRITVIEHFKTCVKITLGQVEAASPACPCLGCFVSCTV